jgi:hypothetical protein
VVQITTQVQVKEVVPNLLGAALTMTYDDTVLNQDASDSLDQVNDDFRKT